MSFKRILRATTLLSIILVAATTQSNAATLAVPSGYATVKAAAAAAGDGDTIEIEAGTYSGDGIVATLSNDNLTIRGVNGRAHLNADGVTISNRKAIFVTTGDNITLENIEFSNAVVPDKNGAGIRHEGGLLTVRNCYFHDNEMGILASNFGYSELFVENTEFNHNGLGEFGRTHNIYVGHIAKFTMQYSYSHHATHGHNVKSRAAENYILYNRIMDETSGNASYQIDLPNGGLSYIIGNTIHQGTLAENDYMISYAVEGASKPVQELYVSGNTFVNDHSGGMGIRLRYGPTAIIVNNIFDNIDPGDVIDDSPATLFEDNIVGEENYFANRNNYDFHLTEDSPAVNRTGDPGTYNEVDLTPLYEYVHPIGSEQRLTNGQLDVGAFEYSDGIIDDPETGDGTSNDGSGDGDSGGSSGSSGCFLSNVQ